MFDKAEQKLLVPLNRMDRGQSDFESMKKVTSMCRYLSRLSKRDVTM